MQSAVVIVSDRCFRKEMEDRAGPVIIEFLKNNGLACDILDIVPDEEEMIKQRLVELCDTDKVQLVVTSGGTGFAPRDVTPEATKKVIQKEVPGMSLAMLEGSLKVTPLAMLSRAVCGIRGGSLIVNLPGSPKAVVECLGFIKPALGHALQLLKNEVEPVKRTHQAMQILEPGTPSVHVETSGCRHHHGHKVIVCMTL